jgi:hypothetical protein
MGKLGQRVDEHRCATCDVITCWHVSCFVLAFVTSSVVTVMVPSVISSMMPTGNILATNWQVKETAQHTMYSFHMKRSSNAPRRTASLRCVRHVWHQPSCLSVSKCSPRPCSRRWIVISSRSAWIGFVPLLQWNRSIEHVGVGKHLVYPLLGVALHTAGLHLNIHEVQPERPFDLCEIKSATLERTVRELTWCNGTTPRNARERSKY